MRALITGAGNMGRAIRAALEARGDEVVALRRPAGTATPRPDPAHARRASTSRSSSATRRRVLANVDYALATGAGRSSSGTTGWQAEPGRGRLDATAAGRRRDCRRRAHLQRRRRPVRRAGRGGRPALRPLRATTTRTSSSGIAATKADRPSGTAARHRRTAAAPPARHKRRARLAEGPGAPEPDTLEVVSLRAGASPGMHVVGFDAPGESIELRITARDRSAYVAGALLAADRLSRNPTARPAHRLRRSSCASRSPTDIDAEPIDPIDAHSHRQRPDHRPTGTR